MNTMKFPTFPTLAEAREHANSLRDCHDCNSDRCIIVLEDTLQKMEYAMQKLRAEADILRADVDMWSARCASAIWLLPESTKCLELREAQDKFAQKLARAEKFAASEQERATTEQKRAESYWKLLCETVEALGKVAPEAAPHAPGWAKQCAEERDKLKAALEHERERTLTLAAEIGKLQAELSQSDAAKLTANLAAAKDEIAQLKAALAKGQENCDAVYDDLRCERDAAIDAKTQAEDELRAAREKIVWGFYEEETPQYGQGEKYAHEISSPLTADEANGMIKTITELRGKLKEKQEYLTTLLCLAKAWTLVWHDKLSPDSLKMFHEIETSILAQKSLLERPPAPQSPASVQLFSAYCNSFAEFLEAAMRVGCNFSLASQPGLFTVSARSLEVTKHERQ